MCDMFIILTILLLKTQIEKALSLCVLALLSVVEPALGPTEEFNRQ